MDFLSNASYSGYRNHIQKDTLQENVKSGNVTDHDRGFLLVVVEQQRHPESA